MSFLSLHHYEPIDKSDKGAKNMNTLNQNTQTGLKIVMALSSIAKIHKIDRVGHTDYRVEMTIHDFRSRDLVDGKVSTTIVTHTFNSANSASKYADNRKYHMTEQDIDIALADNEMTLFMVWGSSVSEEQSLNTREALNERADTWMKYQFARIEWETECKEWNTANGPIFHLKDGQ